LSSFCQYGEEPFRRLARRSARPASGRAAAKSYTERHQRASGDGDLYERIIFAQMKHPSPGR
jgi:hypothetical protein